MNVRQRCPWAEGDTLMEQYHDTEWGVPVHDDRKLFEFMVLDLFQSGLSWRTILYKRAAFDSAFAHFDIARVAAFDESDKARLMSDAGIVRNRLKVDAAITNARQILKIQEKYGSLDRYLWGIVGSKTRVGTHTDNRHIPATTDDGIAMSRALKSEGFRFMGPVVTYAFMQGAGLVNDHLVSCFRYKELAEQAK
jgi:DNA-3-methyladenine glycosylase I